MRVAGETARRRRRKCVLNYSRVVYVVARVRKCLAFVSSSSSSLFSSIYRCHDQSIELLGVHRGGSFPLELLGDLETLDVPSREYVYVYTAPLYTEDPNAIHMSAVWA